MVLANATATRSGIRNHDGSTDGPGEAPPAAIGRVRTASATLMPRPGLYGRMGAAAAPFFSCAVVGGYMTRLSHGPIAFGLPFAILGVLAGAAVLVHHVINAGPVTTWVGDEGIAIDKRRLWSRGFVVRFSDVAAADLITSHFYDPRDARKETPSWLALLFRFQARGADQKVVLSFQGQATYREPGRPDDDDPDTFEHLSPQHAYWFAKAADEAWRARAS